MNGLKSHPDFLAVEKIANRLRAAGHMAYLAGGCVRDVLLNRPLHDFDLATSALPEQVIALFDHTVQVGRAFGVIVVQFEKISVEVATFRSEADYKDGRHPSKISFCDAKTDAERRDFTVNALFYDFESENIIDYVHGLEDLKSGCLRAVGNAQLRFQEDHLRVLRAVRFVGQLGFRLDEDTKQAMANCAPLVKKTSPERIHQELEKLLLSPGATDALNLLDELGLVEILFGRKPLSPDWAVDWAVELNQVYKSSDGPSWRWFLFFQAMLIPDDTIEQLKAWLETYKFSRKESFQIQNMSRFGFNENDLTSLRIGEIVDLAFDPLLLMAFSFYAKRGKMTQEVLNMVRARLADFNLTRPQPLVRAQDLQTQFQAAQLGLAIRTCFYLQLENPSLDGDAIKSKFLALKAQQTD